MLETAAFWGAGCAVAWGFSDFIARFAGRSVGSMVATLGMMCVGLLITALTFFSSEINLELALDGLHWIFAIGFGTAIGSILFFHAVTHGPVTIAAPVVACYPAIAVPISVMLGSRPGVIAWVAMITTLVGVWVVARAANNEPHKKAKAEFEPKVIRRTILFSFSAAVIFAASLSSADRAIEIYGPWQTLLGMRAIGVIILSIVVLFSSQKVRFPIRAWPILIAFGILDTVGHFCLYFGLGLENGEYAIVASVSYTVVTVLLARVFLRELVTKFQWFGISLVILGVGLLAIFG